VGGSAGAPGAAGAASSPGTGGGGASGAVSCAPTSASDLQGAHIDVPPGQPCTFTLAEAAAGISIPYSVVIEHDVPGVTPKPSDSASCEAPGPSGLISFEYLAGSGVHYCVCDVGLCPPPMNAEVTLVAGTYADAFSWDGRSWDGPSDFGNPEGPAFPPGTYTLSIRAIGDVSTSGGSQPFVVETWLPIVLVP
jgi:hypothetical protein